MSTATKRGKNGRRVLRKGFKWAKRGQGCPVRVKSSSRKGSQRCTHGVITRGPNEGKCRTAPLPDFEKFRKKGRKRSIADAYHAGARSYAARRARSRAAEAYHSGARGYASRMAKYRPRDARGRFI